MSGKRTASVFGGSGGSPPVFGECLQINKRSRREGCDDLVSATATSHRVASVLPLIDDAHKLAQRQKQIDYGKNTTAYERFLREVPQRERKPRDPRTPDITEPTSKRQFDGLVKAWRRSLHEWESSHPVPARSAVHSSQTNAETSSACSHLPICVAEVQARAEAEVDAVLHCNKITPHAGHVPKLLLPMDAYLDAELDSDDGGDIESRSDGATAPNPFVAQPVGPTASTVSNNGISPEATSVCTAPSIFGDPGTIDDALV